MIFPSLKNVTVLLYAYSTQNNNKEKLGNQAHFGVDETHVL